MDNFILNSSCLEPVICGYPIGAIGAESNGTYNPPDSNETPPLHGRVEWGSLVSSKSSYGIGKKGTAL